MVSHKKIPNWLEFKKTNSAAQSLGQYRNPYNKKKEVVGGWEEHILQGQGDGRGLAGCRAGPGDIKPRRDSVNQSNSNTWCPRPAAQTPQLSTNPGMLLPKGYGHMVVFRSPGGITSDLGVYWLFVGPRAIVRCPLQLPLYFPLQWWLAGIPRWYGK